ncbi:hypothetical protein F5B22DRAFT_641299 [Xylaria bambusicola]|uniref:uncharacterized protein n=1 Tax=Xylaria bambusicola TaxID=326684 RepID=UPI0020081784|nr:uncharacterized protein F5B22DRAFT_641299 [Xylaria bambusicola]KAI0528328.1 hypothetical protein F5B22DRAFT_641299 [Xylaria bambusicola]
MPTEAQQALHITRPVCANAGCKSDGQNLKACTGCFLIEYCSKACQTRDWPQHQTTCQLTRHRISYSEVPIRPIETPPNLVSEWYNLDQMRALRSHDDARIRWVSEDTTAIDMPAIDVLRLGSNEGDDHSHVLNILFAGEYLSTIMCALLIVPISGCGEMQDFIKTVVSLGDRTPPLRVVLQEKNHCLCLRNIAILLISMGSEDPKIAAELLVQLWYSAFLPIGYFDRILAQLEPYMENSPHDVRVLLDDPLRIHNPWLLGHVLFLSSELKAALLRPLHDTNATQSVNTNRWNIGSCSLRYEHPPAGSDAFVFLRPPFSLAPNVHYPLRLNQYSRTILKPWDEFPDAWFETILPTPTGWQVSRKAFFEERVLLPFGHERNGDWAKPLKERREGPESTGHWIENPFYLGDMALRPPINGTSDPLRCWGLEDVSKNELAPKNDIYGKLFYYVRDMLEKFIIRLKSIKIDIEVHCCEPEVLQSRLAGQQFDRIHASNLGDDCKMGMKSMLTHLSPLLKPKSANSSARLISLRYENDEGIPDLKAAHDSIFKLDSALWERDMEESGAPEQPKSWSKGNYLTAFMISESMNAEQEKVRRAWEQSRARRVNKLGAPLGMEIQENVITTPWPFRINDEESSRESDGPPLDNGKASFKLALAERELSARYYEWQRMV